MSTAKIADGNEHREESEEDDMSDDVCDDLMETSDTLSKRKATLVARMKIKNWLNPEESLSVWGLSQIVSMMSLMTYMLHMYQN